MTARTSVSPATRQPCAHCPWRISNQGKPHPDGWYTKKNLRRLWVGMRRGERMTCHPTDPDNPVTPKAIARGYKPAPENARTNECAGALILQQREYMRFQAIVESLSPTERIGDAMRRYRAAHPRGLTRDGLVALVERAMFGGSPLDNLAMTKPDLNQDDVGHPDLVPWTTDESK